jgi:transposase-like protein
LEAHYRYIYADGIYFTIDDDDAYAKTPILAAMGVKETGEREVLGFMPGIKESRRAWDGFFGRTKTAWRGGC